jgi:hypothetical protein
MKIVSNLLIELYWVIVFSFWTYLSIKFIEWYKNFNIIIFYSIAIFFLLNGIILYIKNDFLLKSIFKIHIKNNKITFSLIFFLIRTIGIALVMFTFLKKTIINNSIYYEGFKVIGLLSFIFFVISNYFRTSILNLEDHFKFKD